MILNNRSLQFRFNGHFGYAQVDMNEKPNGSPQKASPRQMMNFKHTGRDSLKTCPRQSSALNFDYIHKGNPKGFNNVHVTCEIVHQTAAVEALINCILNAEKDENQKSTEGAPTLSHLTVDLSSFEGKNLFPTRYPVLSENQIDIRRSRFASPTTFKSFNRKSTS